MKRAPLARQAAPQVMQELPTLRNLEFSSFPWQTHPIDMYHGPQGWGPFYGPWTPWDWHDPAAHISDRYGSGESNEWQFAPPYEIATLFADPSLRWAYNTSADVAAEQEEARQEVSYTSTISNQVPAPGSFFGRLRELINGRGDD